MKRAAFDALVPGSRRATPAGRRHWNVPPSRWMALGLAALLSWLVFLTSVGLLFFVLGAITEPPLGIVLICIGVPVCALRRSPGVLHLARRAYPARGASGCPGRGAGATVDCWKGSAATCNAGRSTRCGSRST